MARSLAAPGEGGLARGLALERGVLGAHGGDADRAVLGDDLAARGRHGGPRGLEACALLVDDDELVLPVASGAGGAGDGDERADGRRGDQQGSDDSHGGLISASGRPETDIT